MWHWAVQLANWKASECNETLTQPQPSSDYDSNGDTSDDSSDLTTNQLLTQTVGALHVDVAYYALACDLTPVANVMWGHPAGNSLYPSIDITVGHHTLTHPTNTTTTKSDGTTVQLTSAYCAEQRRLIINWYAQTIADFATKLKETQGSSNGSLMDETLLYWTSELSEGNGHGLGSFAYALLGRLGSTIKGGQAIDLASGPHNEVLTAIAKSFDVKLANGVVGEYGTGGLSLS